MAAILTLFLYLAIFSLAAWLLLAVVPSPNPAVTMIKQLVVGIAGIVFLFWLLQWAPGAPHPFAHGVR